VKRAALGWMALGALLSACPPPPVTADNPAPRLDGLGDGALLSNGAHDVVILVHHALDYDAAVVERQLQLARATVDAAKSHQSLRLGVVAVGRRAEVIQPLTDNQDAWRAALANEGSFEITGTEPVGTGLDVALTELSGPRSRGAALPVIFHYATRGEAVTPMLAERLDRAGVVLVYAGSEASGVQPGDGPRVGSLLIPADADLSARAGGLLAWGGSPLPLHGRVGPGWGVRLAVLDDVGDVILRQASDSPKVSADFNWLPADNGRSFFIRVTATHPDRVDQETAYRAQALPQDRQPVVLSVSPEMASPGQTATVSGRFFDVAAAASVIDVGMDVVPQAVTKVVIEFVVPVGARDGELIVRAGGAASPPFVFRVDTDGDTLADNDEVARGTNPASRDSDSDGVLDAVDACPTQMAGAGHIDAAGCTLCTDTVRNAPETDTDCGGPCSPCTAGRICAVGTDCTSQACHAGRCLPDHCASGAFDGDEVGRDCGGSCTACGDGTGCFQGQDCGSGTCLVNVCRAASCANGEKDGTESDTDCGGVCTPCAEGSPCGLDSDCDSVRCVSSYCAPSLCSDVVLNGNESDVDCGGSCAGCDTAARCNGHADCANSVCVDAACVAPTCTDGVQNGDETGRDCGGGRCLACAQGEFCSAASDCITGVCEAGVCAPPRCGDGVRNALETDVDCGTGCDRCALGRGCLVDMDCSSSACQAATLCVLPSCLDTTRAGTETDVDCGGGCIPCQTGRACLVAQDCVSRRCGPAFLCLAPTCDDEVKNGTEPDVDCGSTCPTRCAQDQRCTQDGDCATGVCVSGTCAAPSCNDGVKNGAERGLDCGGGTCARCLEGLECLEDLDCQSDHCIAGRCLSPTCADGQLNSTETSLDCGGNCPGCLDGERCVLNSDCAHGVCRDAPSGGGTCAAPTCEDQVRNGDEGDADCGGACAPCAVDRTCNAGSQCESLVCSANHIGGRCAQASCTDGQRNGGELGQDCGGGCAGCVDGTTCITDLDCASGVCGMGTVGSVCLAPACDDQVHNGGEADLDCGALCPARCGTNKTCNGPQDCADGVCENGVCPPPSCTDDIKNGLEKDSDCGGGCPGCADGTTCDEDGDCASLVCAAADSKCAVPTCSDGKKNGTESAVDCGGTCAGCNVFAPCNTTADCGPDLTCALGGDVAGQMALECLDLRSCSDGVKNQDESDVDCGPFAPCPTCGVGRTCTGSQDCSTSLCVEGRCRADSAFDRAQTPGETDVDCGGNALGCQAGQHCSVSSDCRSGWCHVGVCEYAPSCAVILRTTPAALSGSYLLQPPGEPSAVPVQCDFTTERGGWTLVAHALGEPIKDAASEYYPDLGRLRPLTGGSGVWRGLRTLAANNVDLRFTCRPSPDAPLAVDLSFFSVDWYSHITVGTDLESCFNTPGLFTIPPARHNNLTGDAIGAGTLWERGALVGESHCGDADDFTVDFTESGLDGNEIDGTDWGEDDGQPKCGSAYAPGGTWELWARDEVHACVNNVQDSGEDGVDCGGSCRPCLVSCTSSAECASHACYNGQCEPSRCVDRIKNGTESDVDCGGTCTPCESRRACVSGSDCEEGQCAEGVCRPAACYDGQVSTHTFIYDCIGDILCRQDVLTEPVADCGGPCVPCGLGQECYRGEDCTTGFCPTNPVGLEDGGTLYVGVCTNDPCEDGELTVTYGETDVDCGGPVCGACAGGRQCQVDGDCFTGDCVSGTCRGVASCLEIQSLPGAQASGVYALEAADGLRNVYCDMDTDQGGWTLVAASAQAPLSDQASAYHADLAGLTPQSPHAGIWSGLRTQMGARQDVRFTCRRLSNTRATDMVVDLSFYGVGWYTGVTSGTEEQSCFNQEDGVGYVAPAPGRRDNVSGISLQPGVTWSAESYLEGEDYCASPDDFSVDFADRGMDSNEEDGTDWGMDDGLAKCGTLVGEGYAWFLFVREGSACRDAFQGPGEDWVDCGGPCSACPPVPACVPGTANLDGNPFSPCEPCSEGQFCAGAAELPVGCQPGQEDHDNSPSTPCLTCEPGMHCPGGANDAAACLPGTSDHDQSPATACTGCSPGLFCPGGPTPAVVCGAGQSDQDQDTTTPCRVCETGEYCAGGATPPVSCPLGTADNDGDPATACLNCAAGMYCAGGAAPQVTCAPAGVDDDNDPTTPCIFGTTYTVGGVASGPPFEGPLLLLNNQDEQLQVTSAGPFTFTNPLPEGAPYSVTVLLPPPGMACGVTAGSGIVMTANVTSVVVRCFPAPPPPDFLWLDATDASTITKDGTNQVTQWRDKSGMNRHASASGAGPTWAAAASPAGGAALEFNGSAVALQTAGVQTPPILTMFIVYQMNSPEDWGSIINQGHDMYYSIRKASAGAATNNLNFHIRNNNDAPFIPINLGAWQVLTVVQDIDASFMAHAGGAADFVFQASIDVGTAPITVGNSIQSNQSMGGFIAEIRAYARPLSPQDRAAVEAELAAKHTLRPPITMGLLAHYNARAFSSIVKDGTNRVSTWRDLSGQGVNLGVSGSAPLYVPSLIGSRPGLDFGGGAGLFGANLPLSSEVTVFAVIQHRTPGQWGPIAHHGSRDGDWSLEHAGFDPSTTLHFQSSNDNTGAELVLESGANYILTGRIEGTTRYFSATSADGATVSTSATGVSIVPGNKSFYVGRSEAAEPSNAYVGELLYFDRPLVDPERDMVIEYLEHSWRLGRGSL